MQFATLVVPVVTLPYVAHVPQPSSFGPVMSSHGVAYVVVLFIDWGFSYTAVARVRRRS